MKTLYTVKVDYFTVADPDLPMREGGVGGGHPDPEIRWGDPVSKKFFRPFASHFGRKIRGRAPPLYPPLFQLIKSVDELITRPVYFYLTIVQRKSGEHNPACLFGDETLPWASSFITTGPRKVYLNTKNESECDCKPYTVFFIVCDIS